MFKRALSAALCLGAVTAHAQCSGLSALHGASGFFADGAQPNAADLNCMVRSLQRAMQENYLPRTGGTITGPIISTAAGRSAPVGNNLPTLDFLGNTINFQRRIVSGDPSYAGTRVFLDNYSNGYAVLPWGGYPNVPAFQATATSHPGSNGTVSAVYADLESRGNNPSQSQDQALVGVVTKTGQNSTWGLAIQNQDNTGLPPQAFASVGAEMDILSNGPDTPQSLYDPNSSNRWMLLLAGKVNPVTTYASNHDVPAGTLIKEIPAGGSPTVYIAQTGGKTGVSPPVWPTHGKVVDGDVTWRTGTAYATTIGVGVLAGGSTADVDFNTLYAGVGRVANAGLDLSEMKLGTSYSAAIRLAPDMPIDFSGNGTAAAQNQRILEYAKKTNALTYTVKGTVALAIADTGLASFPGQVQAPLATPKSSSSPCVAGTRTADANYEYVCVATNKWKRAALSDF